MTMDRSRTARNREGLTILELLVAIGIVGLLAALLIPAVQHARETSRRAVCQNNLHQIGLAMHNIADANGAFPTSQEPESGFRRLLPYLDAHALRDALASQKVPASWTVPVFICPDDPVAEVNQVAAGESSYYFNDGTSFRLHPPQNGFRQGTRRDTRPRDVTDGLSQTAAMCERLVRHDAGGVPSQADLEQEQRRSFWWTQTRYEAPGEEALAVQQCRHHRTTVYPQFFGLSAINYFMPWGYDHMLPPNHPACYNGPEDFGIETDLALIPASSLHPGGVHTMLGDGSVHFVSETIDEKVWQALGTRNGHEAVALPFGS